MKLSTTNIYDLLDLLETVEQNLPIRYGGSCLAWGDQPRQNIVLGMERAGDAGDLALLMPRQLIGMEEFGYRRGYYSPPLMWEPCRGGLLSALAGVLNLQDLRPFPPLVKLPQYKLAIYVPANSVNTVLEALDRIGAGMVGRYAGCSFLARGVGRFKPLSGANPIMGEIERWETVDEVMLVTQVTTAELGWAIATVVLVHPYEEVVLDVWELAGEDETFGIGLMGRWTHQDKAGRGPRVGDRVVLTHTLAEVVEQDLQRFGINWVVAPTGSAEVVPDSRIKVWEINEEKFYHPGLRIWRDMIEELCNLTKSPM